MTKSIKKLFGNLILLSLPLALIYIYYIQYGIKIAVLDVFFIIVVGIIFSITLKNLLDWLLED